MNTTHLRRLLGELDAQDQVLETETIHLVACLDSIAPICEADECETLGHARLPVLGQEHSCDATEALEHVAKFALLCQLGNLFMNVSICI